LVNESDVLGGVDVAMGDAVAMVAVFWWNSIRDSLKNLCQLVVSTFVGTGRSAPSWFGMSLSKNAATEDATAIVAPLGLLLTQSPPRASKLGSRSR
jgi:hypothetical protein